jgi:hypothetical protein
MGHVVISLLVPLWFSQIWQNLTKKKKPNLVKFTLGFFSHQKNHYVGKVRSNSLHPSDGKHRRFRSQHKVCGLRYSQSLLNTHPPTHPLDWPPPVQSAGPGGSRGETIGPGNRGFARPLHSPLLQSPSPSPSSRACR